MQTERTSVPSPAASRPAEVPDEHPVDPHLRRPHVAPALITAVILTAPFAAVALLATGVVDGGFVWWNVAIAAVFYVAVALGVTVGFHRTPHAPQLRGAASAQDRARRSRARCRSRAR